LADLQSESPSPISDLAIYALKVASLSLVGYLAIRGKVSGRCVSIGIAYTAAAVTKVW
jgi:hypothetical protein